MVARGRRGGRALPARLATPRPVFLEPTGRRWRVVQLSALVVAAALIGLTAWQLAPIAAMLRAPLPGPSAETVVEHLGSVPAVVGDGPLVRLADVHGARFADPFTDADLGAVTASDRARLRGARTVVQRYGYAHADHRILLTFDDGPDPTWTPKLLDVLTRARVRATFFVTGRAAAKYPDIVRRIAREGHLLADHSLTHTDLGEAPSWRARLEIEGTDRLLASLTGRRAGVLRPPYDGGPESVYADEALAVARAQQLGRPAASYDHDTFDWAYGGGSGEAGAAPPVLPAQIPLPELDGRPVTLLMHDAGGDRSRTLDFVEHRLVPAAQAAGYRFATVDELDPALAAVSGPAAAPGSEDQAMSRLAQAWLVAPDRILGWLFVAGVAGVAAASLGYTLLALVRRRRRRPLPLRDAGSPGDPIAVTVLVAAYNEATVIEATLRSLVASRYPVREFVVVDDGSTDGTAEIVVRLAATLDPRIRVVRQPNGRKPAALNTGLRVATGDVVVTVDADTHADPDLVGSLVRHFEADLYGTLGAVAGVVRVGNRRRNLLTRWQGLEYVSLIGVERAAHDLLGAITIVPGACAAWRRDAVRLAGGFSDATLAEDNDLTLTLHRLGWRVTQDDRALAATEAPEDVDSLLRQRQRWVFGSLQATVKHRDMLLRPRYGWLGMLILPSGTVSMLVPLVALPFVAVMSALVVAQQGPLALALYYLLFTAVQGVCAAVAVRLLREHRDQLVMVPLYRVIYEPLRAYLLYRTAYLALRGLPMGWNKLRRTGALNTGVPAPAAPEPVLASSGREAS
jgi:cellulose synthase/poly-beta-1,6-N-acetylglucosamine synthase-like glycosyltransferase/peptidoglycan/xylan/chitin deacetylase (PgdA/CDA1 family)